MEALKASITLPHLLFIVRNIPLDDTTHTLLVFTAILIYKESNFSSIVSFLAIPYNFFLQLIILPGKYLQYQNLRKQKTYLLHLFIISVVNVVVTENFSGKS